jgi:hypothetical protein
LIRESALLKPLYAEDNSASSFLRLSIGSFISILKLTVLMFFVLLFCTSYSYATDYKRQAKAYENYKLGVSALDAGNYNRAKTLFKKALSFHGVDEQIAIEMPSGWKWVSGPRGRIKEPVIEPETYDYKPNELFRDAEIAINLKKRKNKALAEALYKSENPPVLTTILTVKDSNNNGLIEAFETVDVELVVNNKGLSLASNVKVLVVTDNGIIKIPTLILAGSLKPGQRFKKQYRFKAGDKLRTGKQTIKLRTKEADGFDGAPIDFLIASVAYEAPKFAVVSVQSKSLNKAKTMFGAQLSIKIKYMGDGSIMFADNNQGRYKIPAIKKGQTKVINTEFLVRGSSKNIEEQFKFKLNAIEHVNKAVQVTAFSINSGHTQLPETIALLRPRGSLLASMHSLIQAPKHDGIAIVVGNSNYQHVGNVDYASNDAKAIRDHLVYLLGYKEKNVDLILNASAKDFRKAFGVKSNDYKQATLHRLTKLSQNAKLPVFIYYSGHGAPQLNDPNKAYLVPTDIEMNDIAREGYSIDDLYDSVASLNMSDVTIVLDACFSGRLSNSNNMIFNGISPAMLNTTASLDPAQISGATVFTSTSPHEVGYWYDKERYSLFSYYFMKGLQGAADMNGDHVITAGELKQFSAHKVAQNIIRMDKGSDQTPRLMGKDRAIRSL